MDKFDISVIMPSYNSEKTISKSIESILNQDTLLNIQIVIVDDGSTDNTVNIEKYYANQNSNIKLLSQNHKYQAEARNYGIKSADANYIMFCDDDDYYSKNMIDILYKNIIQSKLVICGIKKKFNNGRVINEVKSNLRNVYNNDDLIGKFLTRNKEIDVGLWNKIFYKKIIDDNDIKMTNDNFFEDSLFILNYLLCISYNDIKFIEKPLYILNKRKGSTTNTYDPKLLSKCNNYIHKVKKLIIEKNEKTLKYIDSFNNRIMLFFINRNILNDKNWNVKKQSEYLIISYSGLRFLDNKYKIFVLLAKYFPNIYRKLYFKVRDV